MEPTVFTCVSVGVTSLLLVLNGLVCLLNVENACLVTQSSSIVMLIIGASLLVPVVGCLYAAQADICEADDQEETQGRRHEARPRKQPRRVLIYLYAGHLLSAWGDRMWQFAVPILFMEIFVDTLQPSACFSLVMYTTCLVAIPSVGRQLDAVNRWKSMRLAIVLENITIIACTALLGAMLLLTSADGLHKPEWTWPLALLFVGTLICGGVGQVLSEAQTLSIERDWVMVIAQNSGVERSSALMCLNSTLRRIDLACKMLGPLAFGVIMDFAGRDPTKRAMIGVSTVAIWNGLSTPLEYFMTRDIYTLIPELATKDDKLRPQYDEEQKLDAADSKTTLSRYAALWRNYIRHPVFLLSFHTVPLLLVFLQAGESRMSDYVMLSCMVGARMWLWCGDLAETQIMQEWIEPSHCGAINAMQTATYQLFFMIIQLMGVVFHDPSQFQALVFFSVSTILAAAVGFTYWDARFGQHRSLYVQPIATINIGTRP
ncbi:unnamed protein product [Peronospora destructor]|uniref:Solute carrier family 40 member n=1 Tax=Peronospora destructor TaxID=86335 RepID=A0AAV0V4Q3_9STRA|nr:unnamed protein product [Peronospora destructor]